MFHNSPNPVIELHHSTARSELLSCYDPVVAFKANGVSTDLMGVNEGILGSSIHQGKEIKGSL